MRKFYTSSNSQLIVCKRVSVCELVCCMMGGGGIISHKKLCNSFCEAVTDATAAFFVSQGNFVSDLIRKAGLRLSALRVPYCLHENFYNNRIFSLFSYIKKYVMGSAAKPDPFFCCLSLFFNIKSINV